MRLTPHGLTPADLLTTPPERRNPPAQRCHGAMGKFMDRPSHSGQCDSSSLRNQLDDTADDTPSTVDSRAGATRPRASRRRSPSKTRLICHTAAARARRRPRRLARCRRASRPAGATSRGESPQRCWTQLRRLHPFTPEQVGGALEEEEVVVNDDAPQRRPLRSRNKMPVRIPLPAILRHGGC